MNDPLYDDLYRPSVAVIGAGPAGLFAAERLADAGFAVNIYDRMPSAGRKFLMAGRGGLNLTHGEPLETFLSRYGDAPPVVLDAIRHFPPDALRAWADELGQDTFVGSSGRVFPRAMKASPLLRQWLARLGQLGVRLHTRHRWVGWSTGGALLFKTDDGGEHITRPDATLLALGGASWPRLGSDGAWVDILARRGIHSTPLVASNVGFNVAWSDDFRSRFAGAPLKTVAFSCGRTSVRGEAVITGYGIEGGAIYGLSSRLRTAIALSGRAILEIDLRPDLTMEQLVERLAAVRKGESRSNALRKAAKLSPVAIGLLREAGDAGALPSSPAELAARIKSVPVTLLSPQPIDRAISTAGGIAFDAIDDHFMLKAAPGVFVAGEMLDWDAPTGGYLLQATFATASVAADGIIRRLTPSRADVQKN